MKYTAYWLHDKGDVVPVETIHIAEVIKDPQRFSYTKEKIEEMYARYNEPVGFEGKAREKIMMDLIKNYGWVRARYRPRNDTWIIELHSLSDELCVLLSEFFQQPEAQKSKHTGIKIIELCAPGGMKAHEVQPAKDPILNAKQKQALYQEKIEKIKENQRKHFVPHLLRVGAETRPSQILICSCYGLARCFFVKAFNPELSREKMLTNARQAIVKDMKQNGDQVPFFGKKVGYALYFEYDLATPLSIAGEILNDVVVEQNLASATVSVGGAQGDIVHVNVPKFVPKESDEKLSVA